MALEFRGSDGLTVRYYAWGSGDALPPVFLHHGFTADAHLDWVDPGIVAALVARGRRVHALVGAALRVLPGDHLAVMRHPDSAAAVADFLTPAG
ncbi:hypothetical protein [Streptomyces roseolilacinus]|uniref:hypothetical protein n=1 Tax=Streptomyces roseolilacinus TaxID=66904 RepID=UPI001676F987|nr:hypothetical protein [Streptomyces roseolilacinus]